MKGIILAIALAAQAPEEYVFTSTAFTEAFCRQNAPANATITPKACGWQENGRCVVGYVRGFRMDALALCRPTSQT